MATIMPSRITAEVDGDFVMFLIGMRINKPWKIQYEAVYSAMPPFGLGMVGRLVPASGTRESARGRMAERPQPVA
jgi:hypothetical protein